MILAIILFLNSLSLESSTVDFIEVKAKSNKPVNGDSYPYCGIAYIKEKVIFTLLLTERNKLYLKPQSQFVYEIGCSRETMKKKITTNAVYTLRVKWSTADTTYYISSIKELE